jgi:deoxyribonuclease V
MKNPQDALRMHRWDVTPAEARDLQLEWRGRVERRDRLGRIRRVAGADLAFDRPLGSGRAGRPTWKPTWKDDEAVAGIVVFSYPAMEELERVSARLPVTFPYVPGLLSFREIPALLAALALLTAPPGLIFCDGQGFSHPRRFGLASHLGVLLDVPTIGCAKSRLIGEHSEPAQRSGAWAPLMDAGERIGAALRTRTHSRPMYISTGHRLWLERAMALTMEFCDGRRIPVPTRVADRYVAQVKREGTSQRSQ